MKKALPIIALFVLVLFALDLEITNIVLNKIGVALSPVGIGVFFALLFKAPVDFFEKTIFASPKLEKARKPLALALSLIVGAGFIVLVCYLILPELTKSLSTLKESVQWLLNGGLEKELRLPEKLKEWFKNALEKALTSTDNALPNMLESVSNTVKSIINGFLGLMLAITMLLGSKELSVFCERISIKIFGQKRSDFLKGALGAVVEKFSKYLAGSLVEAVIFGTFCYFAFLIFKVPYPLLLAVVVGLFNLVPTVGGYIGGAIGVIVLITVSWKTALVFVGIMLVLQQVEQVTTYPVVVGRYVGLSPFFVLLSVVLGGGLFGFWGLLLGVPVVAFIYNLVNVMVQVKTEKGTKEQN